MKTSYKFYKMFENEPTKVFFWLLECPIDNVSNDKATTFRYIAGKWIYAIYRKTLKNRSSIIMNLTICNNISFQCSVLHM